MKRETRVALCVFLVLSLYALDGFASVKGESQDLGFVIHTNVTFSNNGTSDWGFTQEDKAISLFMNNTWQTVQLTNYSYSIETLETDEDKNQLAVLQFPKSEIKPGENVSYAVTYNVISKPRLLPELSEDASGPLEEIPENLKEEYCRVEKNWLINDQPLRDLADNLTKGETKVLTIVKEFVTWIDDNVGYGTHEVPLYANETFTNKTGDCDDQAILLITLCRICEIPAYLQIGCIYLPEVDYLKQTYWQDHVTVVLKRIGWHGWAMVYVPPWGWLPVDLTYVRGGLTDPLNAIRGAAATMQTVIQYMNISKTDYVASARDYRKVLQEQGFYIYEEDEIISTSPLNPWDELIWRLLPLVLIAVVVPAVSITVIAFIYLTTRRKEPEEAQTQAD